MTISSTVIRTAPYAGNDATTTFAFTFKCYAKAHVLVVTHAANGTISTKTLDSDYSVTLNADQNAHPGGSISYPLSGSPLATGATLTIASNAPDVQATVLPDGGPYNARVVSDMSDYRTILSLQKGDSVSRSIQIPVTDPLTSETSLPGVDEREDTVLVFNSDGDSTAITYEDFVTNLVTLGGLSTTIFTDMTSEQLQTLFTDLVTNATTEQFNTLWDSLVTNMTLDEYTTFVDNFLSALTDQQIETLAGELRSHIGVHFQFALGDQINTMGTGVAVFTTRLPSCVIQDVRGSLKHASSSGKPTFDIKINGTSIFTTKLTIDVNEKTSTSAAVEFDINDGTVADDAEVTFNIDAAGTGAIGPMITLYVKYI